MSKTMSFVTAALMLAMGFAGAASAADAKKAPPAAHPRSQASLQCSADADAKNLHGKARVAFRHDCLRKAAPHKATYKKPAQPTAPANNAEKPYNKT
ncbi:PsiF family protein [Hyphomicrobium sp.]|uniref:PsiF family protein n=1 Tax=Hyphomicrobium sp. TaxID=82 RepID=UPI003F6E4CC7